MDYIYPRQRGGIVGRVVHGDAMTDSQLAIKGECDLVRDILIEKNRKYGNSALQPCRVFSKSDTIEQINVRIDDKLSRIMSSQPDDTEDSELDLIGYLILKRVHRRLNSVSSS